MQRYIVFGICSHEFVKIHSTRVKNSFRATGYWVQRQKDKNAPPFLFNYEPLLNSYGSVTSERNLCRAANNRSLQVLPLSTIQSEPNVTFHWADIFLIGMFASTSQLLGILFSFPKLLWAFIKFQLNEILCGSFRANHPNKSLSVFVVLKLEPVPQFSGIHENNTFIYLFSRVWRGTCE